MGRAPNKHKIHIEQQFLLIENLSAFSCCCLLPPCGSRLRRLPLAAANHFHLAFSFFFSIFSIRFGFLPAFLCACSSVRLVAPQRARQAARGRQQEEAWLCCLQMHSILHFYILLVGSATYKDNKYFSETRRRVEALGFCDFLD